MKHGAWPWVLKTIHSEFCSMGKFGWWKSLWVMKLSSQFGAGFHIRSLNHMFDSHGKMDSTWPFHWFWWVFWGITRYPVPAIGLMFFLLLGMIYLLQKKGLRYERMLERCVAYHPVISPGMMYDPSFCKWGAVQNPRILKVTWVLAKKLERCVCYQKTTELC